MVVFGEYFNLVLLVKSNKRNQTPVKETRKIYRSEIWCSPDS